MAFRPTLNPQDLNLVLPHWQHHSLQCFHQLNLSNHEWQTRQYVQDGKSLCFPSPVKSSLDTWVRLKEMSPFSQIGINLVTSYHTVQEISKIPQNTIYLSSNTSMLYPSTKCSVSSSSC